MNRNKIRVGVIGVGYLGKFHLEKYKMNKSVNLTSIADINNDNLDSIKYSKLYKIIWCVIAIDAILFNITKNLKIFISLASIKI